VNFREIKKVYDAKNIAAMIKRLLMTKEWKLVRMVLILCMIALFLWVVLGFLSYSLIKTNTGNLANCQAILNQTLTNYNVMFNKTLTEAVSAGSTINI
jgi:hypothetical protein